MRTVPRNVTDPKGRLCRKMIQIRNACSVYDSDACGRCLLGIRDGGVNEVFSGSFLVGSYMSESKLFLAASLHLTPVWSVSLLAVLV
jgi:hypothetical protein